MEEKKGKKILVSGMKPTGELHLGNFFGALKQVTELQETHESSFFIADLHALTSVDSPSDLSHFSRELILDCLGVGMDPRVMTLYRQSRVPEVTELAWILSCRINVSYLTRAHAYKDAQNKNKEVNAGTFTYPILMAADILIQKADIVPVGEDQRQHIEYTRDIADRFNAAHGTYFELPEGFVPESVATIPGTDGQKMSKSYKNTIPLFAEKEVIQKAVMSMPTDSKGVDDPKDPDTCSLFRLHSLISPEEVCADIRKRYTEGGIGYKEVKERLIESLDTFIAPLRERRRYYEENPDEVNSIITSGEERARSIAREVIRDVRSAIGLTS